MQRRVRWNEEGLGQESLLPHGLDDVGNHPGRGMPLPPNPETDKNGETETTKPDKTSKTAKTVRKSTKPVEEQHESEGACRNKYT